ncbi:MAG: SIMPL domain-containing protein [Caulobacterales bacterium]|nr:SIMPL domain-containing protein [Caulobacterales bacterium]
MRLAIASSCALALFSAAGAPAQDAAEPGRLTIEAVGQAAAAPDLATVRVGVEADGATAAEAMAGQREAMTAVIAALQEAGVAERDIQTTALRLYPVRRGSSSRMPEEEPRIAGYTASNQVSAVVRGLEEVGPTLDALVEAGANDIQGVTFGVEDEDALADAARRDAIAKMQTRADLYGEAAGLTLGPIIELREAGGRAPGLVVTGQRAMALEATPVAGGELTVSVTVTGVYEIAR